MGFYGNITNTSGTQFQFDKIYSNRVAMDANINKDGIYVGRYILVEYDKNVLEDEQNFTLAYDDPSDSYLYKTMNYKNERLISRIKYNAEAGNQYEIGTEKALDAVGDGWVCQVGRNRKSIMGDDNAVDNIENYEYFDYYVCTGSKTENNVEYAVFAKMNDTNYAKNLAIDTQKYGVSRGYDSTVWVKTSVTEKKDGEDVLVIKYVQIAELNSVVPTFDITVDPPTMSPVTPHFDIDSTNVYYKLHLQPIYGLRVDSAEDNNNKSDETTYWTRENYDTKTGLSTEEYWDFKNKIWVAYNSKTQNIPEAGLGKAAIYYNKPAFAAQTSYKSNRSEINKTVTDTDNISILPTGQSGTEYNNHKNNQNQSTIENDIQEMKINLPSIGNMMSDAWDIIHGENRNDSPEDSLQGKLDFFNGVTNRLGSDGSTLTIDGIQGNEIPIQSSDGKYLVGSTINGVEVNSDDILFTDESFGNKFTQDDRWIDTEINTSGSANKTGKNYHRNAISIHHKFTPIAGENTTKNLNTASENTIDLYTPVVDAAGHVVGENTETITLPYGYKIVSVENTDDITEAAIATGKQTQTADNTQDTLAFEASNRWIKFDTASDDIIKIGHLHSPLQAKGYASSDTELTGFGDSFNILKYTTDAAGHLIASGEDTITLPKGSYKNSGMSTNPTNIITSIGFTDTTGEITSTYGTTNTLKLNSYTIPTSISGGIGNNDTINSALGKLEYRINDLDYLDSGANVTQFVSKITQKDGKITVERANAGSLTLTGYSLGTDNAAISDSDNINQAFGKLQVQMNNEVNNRNNAIATAIANIVDKDDNGQIDKLAEVIEWINNNPSTATQMQASINTLNELVGTTQVSTQITNKINTLDKADTAQTGQYVSAVSEANGIITVNRANLPTYTLSSGTENGTIKLNDGADVAITGLGSAAYTDSTNYVSNAIYETKILELEDRIKALEDELQGE